MAKGMSSELPSLFLVTRRSCYEFAPEFIHPISNPATQSNPKSNSNQVLNPKSNPKSNSKIYREIKVRNIQEMF
jgi:hypothetical protein